MPFLSISSFGLMGTAIAGFFMSSMALNATDTPGHDRVPTCQASLLFVVRNSVASLVDLKEKRTFVSPTVGAE